MWNRFLLIYIIIFSCLAYSSGQDCNITVRGVVVDPADNSPLDAVNIFFLETDQGTVSNEDGSFILENVCHGDYHLVFSHIGCAPKQYFMHIHSDTTLNVIIEHTANLLNGVVIQGQKSLASTQSITKINQKTISDNSNKGLASLLDDLPGVNTLNNGAGIAKPVVHGLYGNRLTILNNGIAQSGQQWGNDHSPEIDPLIANQIKVVKGTSALEVMGSNLGAVILVEPKKIEREPHMHGRGAYFFDTNGNGHSANIQVQQYSKNIGWKINGTLKKYGDRNTPDYLLTNTGSQEANFALQLEENVGDRWYNELYLSTFNTELGVLRGSHISNVTDLESAIGRDEPFFTSDTFSYKINAPRQIVNHHLIKAKTRLIIDDSRSFDATAALQVNNRKEYDIRRGNRTSTPALSLLQYNLFSELKYSAKYSGGLSVKVGTQLNITDNTNNPETGVLPLIPDYRQFDSGAFLVLHKSKGRFLYEAGIRYDLTVQNVVQFSRSIPVEIVRNNNTYHNLSASSGLSFAMSDHVSLETNVGYATRNPAINELYSQGLHQGVSGIEEGDSNLNTEKSIKGSIGLRATNLAMFSFESLLYYQNVNDYIFLTPQDQIRLTIRGAFPVYIYTQTDARLIGLDLSSSAQISKSTTIKGAYSYIHGRDLSNSQPLVFMPSNTMNGSIAYEYPEAIQVGNQKLENLSLNITNQYTFEQTNLNIDQDFLAPPPGYYLLNVDLAADLQLSSKRIRFTLKANNLLNTTYRNYLNRQRYFSDDLGRSIVVGLQLKF